MGWPIYSEQPYFYILSLSFIILDYSVICHKYKQISYMFVMCVLGFNTSYNIYYLVCPCFSWSGLFGFGSLRGFNKLAKVLINPLLLHDAFEMLVFLKYYEKGNICS